jgi:hypothetical protein
MMHLTEEEMIEQAYGERENTVAVESRFARHLAVCPLCEEAFAELKRDLAEVDRIQAPARDDLYGARVWAAIADSLPVYKPKPRTWWAIALSSPWNRGLAYAAVTTMLVSCAFYAGRLWEQQKRQLPVAIVSPVPKKPQQPKQPIVVVVLDDHLDRSERFLVELKHADLDSTDMASPLRDEARSLLTANRICRQKTNKTADPELTTALDHLDTLLGEAADAPGGLNAQSISRLQEEMNADGVLFEVRVVRSRIAHNASANNPQKGGTI